MSLDPQEYTQTHYPIQLEKYRCPIKIELVRVAIPWALFILGIGVFCGYGWCLKAIGG